MSKKRKRTRHSSALQEQVVAPRGTPFRNEALARALKSTRVEVAAPERVPPLRPRNPATQNRVPESGDRAADQRGEDSKQSREAWLGAIRGVQPLQGGGSSGRVSAVPVAQKRSRRGPAERVVAPPRVRWHADGAVQGVRPGRDFALEMLHRCSSVDETLDLHGCDVPSARLRVEEFVRTRRARGVQFLRIVHGRGAHSPDGASVLCNAAVDALCGPAGIAHIEAFCSETNNRGALLVALTPREAAERVRAGRSRRSE